MLSFDETHTHTSKRFYSTIFRYTDTFIDIQNYRISLPLAHSPTVLFIFLNFPFLSLYYFSFVVKYNQQNQIKLAFTNVIYLNGTQGKKTTKNKDKINAIVCFNKRPANGAHNTHRLYKHGSKVRASHLAKPSNDALRKRASGLD